MEWWAWLLIILAVLIVVVLVVGYFYNQKYAKTADKMAEVNRRYGAVRQY